MKERALRPHRPLTPSTTDMVLEYEDGFDRVSELPLIATSIMDHKPLDYSLSLLELSLAHGATPQARGAQEAAGAEGGERVLRDERAGAYVGGAK